MIASLIVCYFPPPLRFFFLCTISFLFYFCPQTSLCYYTDLSFVQITTTDATMNKPFLSFYGIIVARYKNNNNTFYR